MEHMSKTSADVSEVVFHQPEEKAGAMEPDGSVLNRHKEEEWSEDTESYHGARPRTTEFDRLAVEVLGATSGGKEENVKLRDIVVPRLHPEQQIGRRRRYRRHHEGNHAGTRVTNRGDLGLCRMNRCWALGVWRTSGKTPLVGTDKTTNGHL